MLQLEKEFIYDVIFWSTLLLVATSATARKEFIYDVIFLSTLLLIATGATARKDCSYDVILLEYLATGCYRCYSSQEV